MLNALSDSLVAAAEIGGNQLLMLDDNLMRRCTDLQGKTVAIEFSDLEETLYCHPGNWGIRLSRQAPGKTVDATISGRLFAILSLATDDDKVSTSIRERVSINGDAKVTQQFQQILDLIEVDQEAILSKYTGDVLAFQINRQVNKARDWFEQSFNSLMMTNSEFLREESRMTPTRPEFERFQHEIITLRQDVERSEARIRQLLKSRSNNTST